MPRRSADDSRFWNREGHMARNARGSQLQEWNDWPYGPRDTFLERDWRQHWRQRTEQEAALADYRQSSFPGWRQRGVNIKRVEEVIGRLTRGYTPLSRGAHARVGPVVRRLRKLALEARPLAQERLLPGEHVRCLENAITSLEDAVVAGPPPVTKPKGAPSKKSTLEEACDLVELLRPLGAPFPKAAELLTNLGFPYTAASLKSQCRRMRREKSGTRTQ
jgi:hypothetical protein